jgi:UDP-glucose 4-epimerase
MKKALITGGAGFVGTALIRKLIRKYKNIEIVSIDNYSSGYKSNHIKSKKVIYLDKDTQTLIPKKFDVNNTKSDIADVFEPDVVFHFGEFSRIVTSFDAFDNCWDYNMQGTKMVLDYCVAKKAKLIYSASSSKFGNDGKDENLSPYAWMKAKMVELIKNYADWFDLRFEITYFYNAYGPGQVRTGDYATVIGIFEEQYSKGEPLTVVESGNQTRDFTHINDIVLGIILATENGQQEEYPLGTAISHKIIDVAKMFDHEYVMIPERRGERFYGKAVPSLTYQHLGWSAKIKLEDYIAKIVAGK